MLQVLHALAVVLPHLLLPADVGLLPRPHSSHNQRYPLRVPPPFRAERQRHHHEAMGGRGRGSHGQVSEVRQPARRRRPRQATEQVLRVCR